MIKTCVRCDDSFQTHALASKICRPCRMAARPERWQNCQTCPQATKVPRKFCNDCLKQQQVIYGIRSAASKPKRSKNERYLALLCQIYFSSVWCNRPIFDGWDADIILPKLKIAILWNGVWHYQQIHSHQSLTQIQSRDKIKLQKILDSNYLPLVIQDLNKYNPIFVENQFISLIDFLITHQFIFKKDVMRIQQELVSHRETLKKIHLNKLDLETWLKKVTLTVLD